MARLALALLTTFLFVTPKLAHAQRSTLILGEWVYSEPIGKAEMDVETQETMDTFFSSMWFSFQKDGTYQSAVFGMEEAGTWKMNGDGTRITLTPKEGPVEEVLGREITATTWLMELEPGKGFKLVRGTRKE